jgi:hypothetical protein
MQNTKTPLPSTTHSARVRCPQGEKPKPPEIKVALLRKITTTITRPAPFTNYHICKNELRVIHKITLNSLKTVQCLSYLKFAICILLIPFLDTLPRTQSFQSHDRGSNPRGGTSLFGSKVITVDW